MSGVATLRPLEAGDFEKGYLALLGQLTTVGTVTEERFKERLAEILQLPHYTVMVAEDEASQRVVGTATLLVELKFIHECGKVGHIEDVVVDQAYRGQKLGKRLIQALLDVARGRGCYKAILDCSQQNVPFYETCGLKTKELQMVTYFDA